ncbi:uncharacterized protein LOC119350601 [Triticum dicoccoides]|nr:uncharacterized protein LOC119350601 [Triticum dicoccoides]
MELSREDKEVCFRGPLTVPIPHSRQPRALEPERHVGVGRDGAGSPPEPPPARHHLCQLRRAHPAPPGCRGRHRPAGGPPPAGPDYGAPVRERHRTGAAPRVTFPTVSVQLNVTFLLVVRVRNPNPASFRYSEAATTLLYRGAPVGSAVVPAGTVPSRGTTTMRLGMTVQADKVVEAAGIGGLLGDVLAGEMEFEARTDVKGRVTFLGFVKRNAQGRSACRIAIGVPDVKVRRQECHNEARL